MKTFLAIAATSIVLTALAVRPSPAADESSDSETPKVQELNCYGKPKAWKEGERDVFAMWYDGDKWHVAVRGSKGTKVHYHGRITASAGQVTDMLLIELERKAKRKSADFFVIRPIANGFDFSFANTGAVDGFTFKATDPNAILKCDFISGRDDDPKHNPDIIMIGAKAPTRRKIRSCFPRRRRIRKTATSRNRLAPQDK